MNIFSKKLNRNILVDKLIKYRKENQISNISFEDYINIIEQEFSKSKFINDSDFLMKGRRKFLVDEFYEVLKDEDNYNKKHCIDDPLYFALGNLEEILYGNNMVYANDVDKEKWELQENGNHKIDGIHLKKLRDINERYNSKKIICLEEKQLIEKMIKDFKNKLKERNEEN